MGYLDTDGLRIGAKMILYKRLLCLPENHRTAGSAE